MSFDCLSTSKGNSKIYRRTKRTQRYSNRGNLFHGYRRLNLIRRPDPTRSDYAGNITRIHLNSVTSICDICFVNWRGEFRPVSAYLRVSLESRVPIARRSSSPLQVGIRSSETEAFRESLDGIGNHEDDRWLSFNSLKYGVVFIRGDLLIEPLILTTYSIPQA